MARRKLPEKILTDEEEDMLLNQYNKRAPTSIRNKLMIKIMLRIGLRISEVLNLAVDDIDMMSGKVFISDAKGGKDRVLWVSREVLNDIREWMDIRTTMIREKGVPSPINVQKDDGVEDRKIRDYLFITFKGTPVDDSYMRKKVKSLAKKAGITNWKKVHPHGLRHTFATKYYGRTNDIFGLADNLGHASVQTTQIYMSISDDERMNKLLEYQNRNTQEDEDIEEM